MTKNILVILHLMEWKHNGDCLRIANIFGRLKKNHNVHALFLDKFNNEKAAESLKPYFNTVTCLKYEACESFAGKLIKFCALQPYFIIKYSDHRLAGTVREKVMEIIDREHIDIVQTWLTYNSQFAEGIKGAAVLHDMCDSYALTFKNEGLELDPSFRNRLTFFKIKNYETTLIKKENTCFVSDKDINLLKVRSDKCRIIHNGVDTELFKPSGGSPEVRSIVFSGDMCFRPNIQAVLYFYENIFGRLKAECPGVKWYIVGGNPADEIKKLDDGRNIIVTGFVKDIKEYLSRAEVVICPMVSGLGIKNKVLEAMAMAKPVVATSAAIAGIDCGSGENVLVADGPDEFLKSVLTLFNDSDLRQKLGKNARDLVVGNYSWDKTVKRYEELYDEIIRAKDK